MFLIIIGILLSTIRKEVTAQSDSDSVNQFPIVTNLSVTAFLDDNYYIRLNISWEDVVEKEDMVSIRFRTNEECNPINELERFSIHNISYIIVPSMELEHPADQLMHGCKYNITIEEEKNTQVYQTISFEVPECVENKCTCRDITNSPYRLDNVQYLQKDVYTITWSKMSDDNLTVYEIFYNKLNNSLRTYIPEANITNIINGIEVPLPDLIENVPYRITIKFVDVVNECTYISSINLKVPQDKHIWMFILLGLASSIISISLIIYMFIRKSPKIRNKINRFCFRRPYLLGTEESVNKPSPISLGNPKEELNVQYTPLEFILNIHNYDNYEIPRNKVIIEEEIDKGAFGKVFKGRAYELDNTSGFTMVAIKQLREGATPEELLDFQNEIIILKKVGVHENIVRLLGCVTMKEPHLMIMELIEFGSLIKHLHKIREKWTKRKKNNIFFPDDMDEDWLENTDKKSSDGSYIQPDEVFHHMPPSPIIKYTEMRTPKLRLEIPRSPGNASQRSQSLTPVSFSSSRLPSCTETEITTVDLEFETPSTSGIRKRVQPVIDHTELQKFAYQIAQGMAYLEKLNIAHRDLAARNILLTEQKTLKISDFGLSRTGPYVSIKSTKLPLRWMAIEAIEERTCDNKSDVWSFGVVLWEIGTLGAFPYEKTENNLILFNLKQGKRLDRPEICTDELYRLMLKCWKEKPSDRPSFQELVEFLNMDKKKVYVDFCEINPKYVFPPTTEQLNIKEKS